MLRVSRVESGPWHWHTCNEDVPGGRSLEPTDVVDVASDVTERRGGGREASGERREWQRRTFGKQLEVSDEFLGVCVNR